LSEMYFCRLFHSCLQIKLWGLVHIPRREKEREREREIRIGASAEVAVLFNSF
jgi:hypothetical protein